MNNSGQNSKSPSSYAATNVQEIVRREYIERLIMLDQAKKIKEKEKQDERCKGREGESRDRRQPT